MIIIGFDSEWVYLPDENRNHILSYQFSVLTPNSECSGIVYTDGPDLKHRWKLADLLGHAIQVARDERVIGREWPDELCAVAHFTRADLAAFRDYKTLRAEFDNLRGSFSTITTPYKCSFYDRTKHQRNLKVRLVDTMAIAPGGTSLNAVGDLHGFPKIPLPSGMIERMDLLLEHDPDLFRDYAIRDAEIAAKHAYRMQQFCEEEGLGDEVPLTIGSMATKFLTSAWAENGINKADVLGTEEVTEKVWTGKRSRKVKKTIFQTLVAEYEPIATEAFHGGRNEAYMFGPTHDDFWFDFDLAGAYSTAMAAIKIPDWQGIRPSKDLDDYVCENLGLARIKFKFPDSVQYPCLPVRSNHGLIFPLEGETYCGSPEIQLARELGAELQIQNGIIVPWLNDTRPFMVFSKKVRENRKLLDKGSVFERAWKEIGNSVYGKIAQGLREKRVYNSRTEKSETLPPSEITQPYLAAYITSLVRAVLSELISRVPSDKLVVSATTDGFITNAKKHELVTSGTLATFFSQLANTLTGSFEIIEQKHVVPQVLCMKTRGQLTIGILDNLPTLQAKAGVQVLPRIVDEAIARRSDWPEELVPDEIKEEAENNWLLQKFFARQWDTKVPSWSLPSMRKMAKHDYDLVKEETEKRLSLEFDWKRELYAPETVMAGLTIGGGNPRHISMSSKPIQNLDTFHQVRERFSRWRDTQQGVLKTEADWERWSEFRERGEVASKSSKPGRGKLVDQAKREFLRQYTNKENGYPGGRYAELAKWLTENGYPTTETDVKNSRRSSKLEIKLATVQNDEVKALLDIIQKKVFRMI